MDGVDPVALLNSLGAQSGQNASAPANIDQQILSLLNQSAPTPDTQSPSSNTASAAQAAYQNSQSKGSTLHVGLGPYLRTDTHIPLPGWLDQGLVGAGGHVLRDLGMLHDPTGQAVANQADQTTAGKVGGFLGDTGLATAATLPMGSTLGAMGLGRSPPILWQ